MPDVSTSEPGTPFQAAVRPLYGASSTCRPSSGYQWRRCISGATSAPDRRHIASASTSGTGRPTLRRGSRTGWPVMGNVAKRVNGRWRARYCDPTAHQRSRDFPRKIDAQRWPASVEVSIGRGEWLDPDLGEVTLGEWSRTWLSVQSPLKPSTALRYTCATSRTPPSPTGWSG